MLGQLVGGGIEGILGGVAKVSSIFVGDKGARDAAIHTENIATYGQFASEFQVRNRTWFDSLIDGLNRLPRPVIVAMVIYYFVQAVRDPIQFQKINLGLDGVPENMWVIAGGIVSFYFVAREMQKSRDKKMAMSKKDFDEHLRRVDELSKRQADRAPQLEDAAFEREMADTSKPMSNAAILEWNRRRRAGTY